jgi:hypothetical protein
MRLQARARAVRCVLVGYGAVTPSAGVVGRLLDVLAFPLALQAERLGGAHGATTAGTTMDPIPGRDRLGAPHGCS